MNNNDLMNSSGKDVDFKINEFLRKRKNKNPTLRTYENKNEHDDYKE